jgi:uncharacterized protein
MSKISPAKARKPGPHAEGGPADAPSVASLRWLGSAIVLVLLGAAVCVWGTLCLAFWQGSWQLLYRPSAVVEETPASRGIAFEKITFSAEETGITQLTGWWCPVARANGYTAIFLHSAQGNLGNAVDSIAELHGAGFDVLAFDYRGYGQSQFAHPSETRWREDAESALRYLTQTRHLEPKFIVVAGEELGADLALETAADHPELAGVVAKFPVEDPTRIIFDDPRARLVPAHWLVGDRWDLKAAAVRLKPPSLWLCRMQTCISHQAGTAFGAVSSPKTLLQFDSPPGSRGSIEDALSRWTDALGRSG